MFWQIPDGNEILRGHLPTTVAYAISSGSLVSQEWLYEAALAWAVQHGAFGAFALLCGGAAAATPLLVYRLARIYGASDVAAGSAAFLLIGARLAASATRPETFAVDAFALELIVLAGAGSALWTVPLVLLWANLHASVALAPLVALLFGVAQALAARKLDSAAKRSFAVASLALAGSLATPHGLRLWKYAFELAVAPSPVRNHLEVWKPLSFEVAGSVTALLPGLLVLMCCGIVFAKRYAGAIATAALCFALTLMHVRYAMFLVIAWSPLIAVSLALRTNFTTFFAARLGGTAAMDARSSGTYAWTPLLALAPLMLYAALHALPTFRAPPVPHGPWQAAADIVEARHLQGNVYAPYVWAAYLHWRALPVRLLIDAHGDPFPNDVWADYLTLEAVNPGWRKVLGRRRIGVVIASADTPLAQALQFDASWRMVERRDTIVVFVLRRPSAANSPIAL